jgi:hypothetical protein
MCAERLQRVLMAIVLSIVLYLVSIHELTFAIILQSFVIIMVLIWAFTDFCPSIWIFGKIFGKCNKEKSCGESKL